MTTMFPKPVRKKDRTFLDSFKSQHCIATNKLGCVGHHVISRGAGGPDELWNVMALTAAAHNEVHQIGLRKFALKYPRVERWLIANGWSFDNIKNKWMQPSF